MKQKRAPIKTRIELTRIEGPDITVELRFSMKQDDEKVGLFFHAMGMFLKRFLTKAEAQEFLRQFEELKAKAVGSKGAV